MTRKLWAAFIGLLAALTLVGISPMSASAACSITQTNLPTYQLNTSSGGSYYVTPYRWNNTCNGTDRIWGIDVSQVNSASAYLKTIQMQEKFSNGSNVAGAATLQLGNFYTSARFAENDPPSHMLYVYPSGNKLWVWIYNAQGGSGSITVTFD
jgi:hypothetical protein